MSGEFWCQICDVKLKIKKIIRDHQKSMGHQLAMAKLGIKYDPETSKRLYVNWNKSIHEGHPCDNNAGMRITRQKTDAGEVIKLYNSNEHQPTNKPPDVIIKIGPSTSKTPVENPLEKRPLAIENSLEKGPLAIGNSHKTLKPYAGDIIKKYQSYQPQPATNDCRDVILDNVPSATKNIVGNFLEKRPSTLESKLKNIFSIPDITENPDENVGTNVPDIKENYDEKVVNILDTRYNPNEKIVNVADKIENDAQKFLYVPPIKTSVEEHRETFVHHFLFYQQH